MAIDGKKLRYWSKHFERWQASGLTQRAYCAREGLALSTFDHWRRQARKALRPEASQAPLPRPVESLTLVPVQIEAAGSDVQLRSPAGWHITLPATLGPDTLAHVLSRLP